MRTRDLCRHLSYEIAIASLALSFCTVAINSALSELFHFQYSSFHTAVSIYLPVLFSLGVFLTRNYKDGAPLADARSLILLAFVCGFWLINYFTEIGRVSSSSLSAYDGKRIWFFVHGVLLSGLVGILARRDFRRFVRIFLMSFCIISTAASLLYLFTFRAGESFTRLLGERALGAGLVACFGVGSCMALLFLHMDGSRRLPGRLLAALIAGVLINTAAIALSATRGAALSAAASVIVFVWMARRSRLLLPTLTFLMVSLVGIVVLAGPYMPEATVRRLLMREQGIDIRYELNRTMLNMILEHPCGRVLGYANTRLTMDYSHNTLLQYIGEAGLLQAGPVLLVLLSRMVRNLIRHRTDLHVRALLLFSVPVLIESFSAGGAYDSLLWFLLFFVFSLRRVDEPVPWIEEDRGAAPPDITADNRFLRGAYP